MSPEQVLIVHISSDGVSSTAHVLLLRFFHRPRPPPSPPPPSITFLAASSLLLVSQDQQQEFRRRIIFSFSLLLSSTLFHSLSHPSTPHLILTRFTPTHISLSFLLSILFSSTLTSPHIVSPIPSFHRYTHLPFFSPHFVISSIISPH